MPSADAATIPGPFEKSGGAGGSPVSRLPQARRLHYKRPEYNSRPSAGKIDVGRRPGVRLGEVAAPQTAEGNRPGLTNRRRTTAAGDFDLDGMSEIET